MTNGQKISHLRVACGFGSKEEFVALCARTRPVVAAYLRGDAWPPADVLTRIRQRLDAIGASYDPEWLIPSAPSSEAAA
jgi:hypothetical protein